jgi:ABC-type transport system involved in multi-copper enzyme maturation permease subunit
MTPLLALAGNTVRELTRNKLLYLIGLFSVLLILGSMLLTQLSVGQWARIINDVSLAAIQLSGAAVAILIGVNVVAGEVDRRTVYVTLAKPVSRTQFLFGKYLGLCVTMFVLVAFMGGLLVTLLFIIDEPPTLATIGALILIFVELCVLATFAMVFSSFTTQTLAVMFTAAVFIIGHLAGDLHTFAEGLTGFSGRCMVLLASILPNLDQLNLKTQAANKLPVTVGHIAASAAYGLCYAPLALFVAAYIFNRRDFK